MRAKHESALQGQALACFNLHRKFGLPPCTTSYHTGFGQRFPTRNLCLDVIGRLPDRVWIEVMAVLARVCVFYGSFKKNKKSKSAPPNLPVQIEKPQQAQLLSLQGILSCSTARTRGIGSLMSDFGVHMCVYIYTHTQYIYTHTQYDAPHLIGSCPNPSTHKEPLDSRRVGSYM